MCSPEVEISLQTHHVDSTLKQRGSDRVHLFSTWNRRGVFVGLISPLYKNCQKLISTKLVIYIMLGWREPVLFTQFKPASMFCSGNCNRYC